MLTLLALAAKRERCRAVLNVLRGILLIVGRVCTDKYRGMPLS